MIFNRSKKLRIISFLVILLTMVAVPLVGVGDRPAQAAEPGQLAPMNPAFLEFWQNPRPEPFYGYIPPPVDLSHLDEIPVERARGFATFPSSFDWRDTGKVTSVKNQNPCGTCWCFGTTSAVESRVLIEESISPAPDYSEQNLACCTDPAWVYLTGNRCMAGGWAWLAADTLIKKGTRLESCDPYDTDTINTESCDDSCQSIKLITDYRMVADQATSPDVIEPIKNAIYNHGPVAMSYCHDDSYMDAGNIYYWPGCAVNANHLVSIVGWDDGIAHPADGGSGAWIAKNSWGTGWGDNGYFYLCYGSASMCEVVSFDYKDYDSDEQIYYWDEAGIVGGLGNWDDYSGWMANIFSSGQNGNLTHVDFWTTSNNAQYEIYVYLDGNISDGLQNLAASQSGSCQEFGYYSIALTSPVSLTNGQSFIIAVRVTTTGYKYPLPAEYQQTGLVDPPIQSGKSFYRHGDSDSWTDAADPGCNLCLRARVTTGAAGEPDITVSPTSFEETLAPDTSQDYTLNIGNAGGATLTYDISDTETTAPTAPAASMKLLSQPASMVLEVPLEGALVGAEATGGVGNGWQDIVTEDFEGAFPGVWNVFPNAGATDAYWGKDGYRNHTGGGSYSAFCAKSGTAGVNPPTVYPDDMNAWMVYGPFSLADATDAELEYYLWLGAEEGYDAVYEMASTDGASFSGVGWTGFSGDWVNMSFDLTNVGGDNLCGEDEVWIAFIFQSDSTIGDEGAFIDDVVLRKLVAGANNPPNTPSNPSPVNHATGVSVDTDLSWTGGDPDVGDTATYDVYFSPSASPSLVSNDQSAASYDPGALSSDTKYYWKIVATDNHAASTTGPVWDFTTGGVGNGWQTIMTEDFEGDFPGTKWVVFLRGTVTCTPEWVKDDYNSHGGSYSGWYERGTIPGNGGIAYGPFDLSDASDAELNFYYFYDLQECSDPYGEGPEVPPLCFGWGASVGASIYTAPYYFGGESCAPADSGGWQYESFDLTNVPGVGDLCGQSQVWIWFWAGNGCCYADTGQGAFIDDVVLRKYTAGGADCPWLDEDPKSGMVAPGDPADSITVSINTAGLSEGDYTANIVIDNNDPDENPTIIPVTLHVEAAAGEPDITVDPTSFEVTLLPDADWSDSLDIGNIGVEALTYTISDEETTGMSGSAAPPSRPSAPDGSNAAALPTHEDEHAPIQVFEQGNTLEELRDKIEQNGYNFTVDHNWVYDMSPEEKEKFFSRHDSGLPEVVDVSDDIGPLARYLGRKQLPSQFDWRNYDGRSYIGGIGNQGSCGSCYAFGACAAAEGTYNVANGLYDGNCSDFSESFIIWCLGSLSEYNPHFYGCEGADYDYFELTALTVEGVCSEADFPYQTWDGCGDHWDAPRITLDSWHRIPCGDINAIKTAIMTYGPVDAAVLVTTAFEAYSGGIYEDSNTDCAGEPCYYAPTNHAIALVGWDDNGDPETNGYWILRNSWGSNDWGEDGYMRIKYRSAVVACEACYLVYSGADCSWLSQEPTSGSVAPGDPADSITVSINTAGLTEGDYTANIVIDNNDPDENPTIIPVTLHVSSGNNPPNTPSNPSPADDATGVSINADLSWTGGDPDSGDTVTYDVHFGTSASPPLVSNDQSATTYDPGTLSYNTKYYWKIVATDHAASTSGPLWDFTTGVSQATSVSIDPQSRTVSPGGSCKIDVWVDAGDNNLKGIDVAVEYDADAMTTTEGDVVGHNLLGDLQMGPEVTDGEVTYALASVDAVADVDASVMTITFTMDADAEPGDYALTITKGDLVDENAEPVVVEINDGTVTVVIGRKGDFDGDGDIDIFDFVHFAAAYGSELGDDSYNPIGDFANDGDIDIYDFVNFAEVYGT